MSSSAPALPRVGLAALLSLGSATLFTALSGLGHADAQRPPVAPLVEVEPVEPAPPPPIAETRDLGFMLHDLDFSNPADPVPRFFRAQMTDGVVDVPAFDSVEVRA